MEKDFLLRVRDSRAYLAESNMFELCDYSVEEHFARIIPPPAEVEVVSAAASVSSGGSSKMSSLLTAGYDFHARIGNSVLAEVKAEAVEIAPLAIAAIESNTELTKSRILSQLLTKNITPL